METDIGRSFTVPGRVAVVTGAASGIGREIAIVLAQAGALVVIADIDGAGLEATAATLRSAGSEVAERRTDIARREEIEALADVAVESFGRLDIWVNCAGTIVSRPIVEAREEEVERLLSVNLKGAYWGCSAAARRMGQGGAIVNISSAGGELPVPGLSLYSMTKAALNMLTRTAATELGPKGIRVNAVAPGWVDTPMGLHSFRDDQGRVSNEKREEAMRSRAAGSPLGLTGEPRDIALAALYLVSDAARFVTGQILRPNGGIMMP